DVFAALARGNVVHAAADRLLALGDDLHLGAVQVPPGMGTAGIPPRRVVVRLGVEPRARRDVGLDLGDARSAEAQHGQPLGPDTAQLEAAVLVGRRREERARAGPDCPRPDGRALVLLEL